MRFLKRKVAKAITVAPKEEYEAQPPKPLGFCLQKPFIIERMPAKKTFVPPKPKKRESNLSKNIVKNYGKAMSAFAASNLSKPYL